MYIENLSFAMDETNNQDSNRKRNDIKKAEINKSAINKVGMDAIGEKVSSTAANVCSEKFDMVKWNDQLIRSKRRARNCKMMHGNHPSKLINYYTILKQIWWNDKGYKESDEVEIARDTWVKAELRRRVQFRNKVDGKDYLAFLQNAPGWHVDDDDDKMLTGLNKNDKEGKDKQEIEQETDPELETKEQITERWKRARNEMRARIKMYRNYHGRVTQEMPKELEITMDLLRTLCSDMAPHPIFVFKISRKKNASCTLDIVEEVDESGEDHDGGRSIDGNKSIVKKNPSANLKSSKKPISGAEKLRNIQKNEREMMEKYRTLDEKLSTIEPQDGKDLLEPDTDADHRKKEMVFKKASMVLDKKSKSKGLTFKSHIAAYKKTRKRHAKKELNIAIEPIEEQPSEEELEEESTACYAIEVCQPIKKKGSGNDSEFTDKEQAGRSYNTSNKQNFKQKHTEKEKEEDDENDKEPEEFNENNDIPPLKVDDENEENDSESSEVDESFLKNLQSLLTFPEILERFDVLEKTLYDLDQTRLIHRNSEFEYKDKLSAETQDYEYYDDPYALQNIYQHLKQRYIEVQNYALCIQEEIDATYELIKLVAEHCSVVVTTPRLHEKVEGYEEYEKIFREFSDTFHCLTVSLFELRKDVIAFRTTEDGHKDRLISDAKWMDSCDVEHENMDKIKSAYQYLLSRYMEVQMYTGRIEDNYTDVEECINKVLARANRKRKPTVYKTEVESDEELYLEEEVDKAKKKPSTKQKSSSSLPSVPGHVVKPQSTAPKVKIFKEKVPAFKKVKSSGYGGKCVPKDFKPLPVRRRRATKNETGKNDDKVSTQVDDANVADSEKQAKVPDIKDTNVPLESNDTPKSDSETLESAARLKSGVRRRSSNRFNQVKNPPTIEEEEEEEEKEVKEDERVGVGVGEKRGNKKEVNCNETIRENKVRRRIGTQGASASDSQPKNSQCAHKPKNSDHNIFQNKEELEIIDRSPTKSWRTATKIPAPIPSDGRRRRTAGIRNYTDGKEEIDEAASTKNVSTSSAKSNAPDLAEEDGKPVKSVKARADNPKNPSCGHDYIGNLNSGMLTKENKDTAYTTTNISKNDAPIIPHPPKATRPQRKFRVRTAVGKNLKFSETGNAPHLAEEDVVEQSSYERIGAAKSINSTRGCENGDVSSSLSKRNEPRIGDVSKVNSQNKYESVPSATARNSTRGQKYTGDFDSGLKNTIGEGILETDGTLKKNSKSSSNEIVPHPPGIARPRRKSQLKAENSSSQAEDVDKLIRHARARTAKSRNSSHKREDIEDNTDFVLANPKEGEGLAGTLKKNGEPSEIVPHPSEDNKLCRKSRSRSRTVNTPSFEEIVDGKISKERSDTAKPIKNHVPSSNAEVSLILTKEYETQGNGTEKCDEPYSKEIIPHPPEVDRRNTKPRSRTAVGRNSKSSAENVPNEFDRRSDQTGNISSAENSNSRLTKGIESEDTVKEVKGKNKRARTAKRNSSSGQSGLSEINEGLNKILKDEDISEKRTMPAPKEIVPRPPEADKQRRISRLIKMKNSNGVEEDNSETSSSTEEVEKPIRRARARTAQKSRKATHRHEYIENVGGNLTKEYDDDDFGEYDRDHTSPSTKALVQEAGNVSMLGKLDGKIMGFSGDNFLGGSVRNEGSIDRGTRRGMSAADYVKATQKKPLGPHEHLRELNYAEMKNHDQLKASRSAPMKHLHQESHSKHSAETTHHPASVSQKGNDDAFHKSSVEPLPLIAIKKKKKKVNSKDNNKKEDINLPKIKKPLVPQRGGGFAKRKENKKQETTVQLPNIDENQRVLDTQTRTEPPPPQRSLLSPRFTRAEFYNPIDDYYFDEWYRFTY